MNPSSITPSMLAGGAERGPVAGAARRLDQAPNGRVFTVRQVHADPQVPERARQLEEIGFYPGERVTVMARGFPGGEPLVVRVGQSTFALRAAEAACVQIDGGSGNPDA
jgi:ferrous iron transport protein A